MHTWKTLQKTLLLDCGKFLQIEKHKIELPDGRVIDDWAWVNSPDFVLVLPVTNQKTCLMFNQVKYAIEGTSIAPVGGYIEPAEEPLIAAKRELQEELGYTTEKWISLGSYVLNGNNGGGKGHFFIALDIKKMGGKTSDDLEEMETVELSFDELENKLLQGEVKVQGWVGLVSMALLYLRRQKH